MDASKHRDESRHIHPSKHHSKISREEIMAILRLIESQKADGVLSHETYRQLKLSMESEIEEGNSCSSCGSPIEKTSKFCTFCGFNMEAARKP